MSLQILCNRYEHPGTQSERGRFFRKVCVCFDLIILQIYTGITCRGETLPLAVVNYSWQGEAHEIRVEPLPQRETLTPSRPMGQRAWEVSTQFIVSPHAEDVSFGGIISLKGFTCPRPAVFGEPLMSRRITPLGD